MKTLRFLYACCYLKVHDLHSNVFVFHFLFNNYTFMCNELLHKYFQNIFKHEFKIIINYFNLICIMTANCIGSF